MCLGKNGKIYTIFVTVHGVKMALLTQKHRFNEATKLCVKISKNIVFELKPAVFTLNGYKNLLYSML